MPSRASSYSASMLMILLRRRKGKVSGQAKKLLSYMQRLLKYESSFYPFLIECRRARKGSYKKLLRMTTTVVVTAVQAIQKTPERNCISTRSGIVGSLVGVVIDQKNKRKFCVKRSPSRDRYFDCDSEILSFWCCVACFFSCIRKCSKCTVRHANQVFSPS